MIGTLPFFFVLRTIFVWYQVGVIFTYLFSFSISVIDFDSVSTDPFTIICNLALLGLTDGPSSTAMSLHGGRLTSLSTFCMINTVDASSTSTVDKYSSVGHFTLRSLRVALYSNTPANTDPSTNSIFI